MIFETLAKKIKLAIELRNVLNEDKYKGFDFNQLKILFSSLVLNEVVKNIPLMGADSLSYIFSIENEIIKNLDKPEQKEEIRSLFQSIILHLKEKNQFNKFQPEREELDCYNILLNAMVEYNYSFKNDKALSNTEEFAKICSAVQTIAEIKGDDVLSRYLKEKTKHAYV